MSGYHPTLTSAVADEHRRDMFRDASRARMIADLPDRDRHQTPRFRAPWWTRATARVARRALPAGA